MKHLVRYGEIGTKSGAVRDRMVKILRQRIEDRLEYEDESYQFVRHERGRIIVESENDFSDTISEIPGVMSVSLVKETDPEIEAVKKASEQLEIGDTFGVEPERSGNHDFDSQDVAREVGSHIEETTGSKVDLEDPETWVKVEVKQSKAFVSDKNLEGPGGLPVGSHETLISLISGGIDSPVAAYRMMVRGTDILPLYFYNKPLAAEDHLLRFKSVLQKLKRFHPSKKWSYYVVDMEDVNQQLLDVGRGRMVLHRAIMFRTAEKIAEKEGLEGIVTGESVGQKSSQTPTNLARTSSEVKMPVHRPLIGMNKNRIVEQSRELGTFEDSKIDSACRTLSPENPAAKLSEGDFAQLKEEVDIDKMVADAFQNAEKHNL